MEPYVIAVLIVACVVLALWLLARRVRTWKEQILHSVSIVESNNAIAHETTRRELSQQLASLEKRLGATADRLGELRGHIRDSSERLAAATNNVLEGLATVREELSAVRNEVNELSQQTNLKRLVRTYVSPPRLVADRHPPSVRFDDAVSFLRSLDTGGDNPQAARCYLETHLRRLARTLDITPAPSSTSRALELGAYMQITPALGCLLGYDEVRGAYLGSPAQSAVRKTASIGNKQIFMCYIDSFDAEKDPFPYPDDYFDVVMAGEILEHLRLDPMHMLLESRRVLATNGMLVLTTPNVASCTSVARALIGEVNPQIYSHYPVAGADLPHVREYTPAEVHDLVVAAGFAVEWLFTEPGDPRIGEKWIGPLLDHLGFPNNLRGEQIYVVARKRLEVEVVRKPEFLYEQP